MNQDLLEFGVRGHDFGKMSSSGLAAAIKSAGYTALQLALAKALDRNDLGPGQLDLPKVKAIHSDFIAAGIRTVVLGCYINPVDPIPEARARALDRFRTHLDVVKAFWTPHHRTVVGTETGWIGTEGQDRQATRSLDTLATFLHSLETLLDHARSTGTTVAIEGVCRHTIWNPQLMADVLRRYPGPELVAIYDPVNYLDTDNLPDQDRLINQAFDLYGDRMAVLHAKDCTLADGTLVTAPAGTGLLNWPLVLRRLAEVRRHLGRPIPALLEDTRPAMLPLARARLEGLLA